MCWVPVSASLGNEASRASILERCISRNCLDRIGFPPLVHIEAARTTIVTFLCVDFAIEPEYVVRKGVVDSDTPYFEHRVARSLVVGTLKSNHRVT